VTLRLSSFKGVPQHMKIFGAVARRRGLSRSALLRLLIFEFIRRHADEAK
jgi:hypothetical protein